MGVPTEVTGDELTGIVPVATPTPASSPVAVAGPGAVSVRRRDVRRRGNPPLSRPPHPTGPQVNPMSRPTTGGRARPELPIASTDRRITIFFVLMAMVFSIAAGRALLLQGIDAPANAQAAAQQLTRTQELKADRGVILDRNGQVLAETQPAFQVIADPWSISSNGYDPDHMTAEQEAKAAQAPEAIAGILAAYLGGSKSDYLKRLSEPRNADGSPNQYELIERKVSAALYQQMANELKNGGWYGIYPASDPVRYYPNGTLASNVLGFVNYDDEGAAGLEYLYNAQLSGIDGKQTYQSSPYGPIPLGDSTLVEPVDGTTFQLTIDAELQWMAQTELANAVAKANAKSGTAIIMAVQTGEVLALATVPTFDSNNPGDADPDNLGNRAITDAYEPGSVQKVLTMAALLDAGLISGDTTVEVPGQIMSGGAFINDAWSHGSLYLTARGVLAKSSNVGTVQLTRQMDKATLSNYLASFGLGSSTGIELPGETGGRWASCPAPTWPTTPATRSRSAKDCRSPRSRRRRRSPASPTAVCTTSRPSSRPRTPPPAIRCRSNAGNPIG